MGGAVVARFGSLLVAWDGRHVGLCVVGIDGEISGMVGPAVDVMRSKARPPRASKYPLRDLQPGEECVIFASTSFTAVYCAVQAVQRKTGKRFQTRRLDGAQVLVKRIS